MALLRARTDAIGELAQDTVYVKRIIRETRRGAYSINRGEWAAESSVIAIGLPILLGH
ncbi:hypothetical protein [Malikia spinosa]|uniref:hypothetical protein n=1 Tax=Malikia spinosa TaxID=86180 RepID=UPI003FA23ABA